MDRFKVPQMDKENISICLMRQPANPGKVNMQFSGRFI